MFGLRNKKIIFQYALLSGRNWKQVNALSKPANECLDYVSKENVGFLLRDFSIKKMLFP